MYKYIKVTYNICNWTQLLNQCTLLWPRKKKGGGEQVFVLKLVLDPGGKAK